jgi:PAS domain S-box-containing protein
MTDRDKTKEQLLDELVELRRRVAALEDGRQRCPTTAGTVTIGVDSTARKRAEDALLASDEWLRVTFEEAPVGMVIGVGDGVIAKANRAICRMSGFTQEELIGRHIRDLTHPDDRKLSDPFVKRLLAGEIRSFTLEKRFLSKDGKAYLAQATTVAAYGPDGKIAFALGVVEDITDRKRAEEAIRQSERRFRNYFEQGLIGMAVTSVDKRWLEVNDRLCEIMGYSREELVQTNWAALTHPDDVEPNVRRFNLLLAGEIEHFTLNKRFLKKDGCIVHATIYTRAFRTEDGTIDHIVTLIEDITARKQAEEALRQSHDELRVIYDGMVDGLHILDLATLKPVRANPALCRMMGYSEEEVLSLSPADVHPPEELPKIKEGFQAYLEGRTSGSSDVPLVRKDGSVFYADITASRIVYNGTPCVICFFRDTTERRKAHDALERERQSLWRMLQASDHERQTISYEIHDGLAQYLAAAGMQFQAHDALRQNSPDKARKAYETAVELVRQAHRESRRLISEVRPPVIDEIGLETAISHLVHEHRRHGGPKIECRSSVQFGRLPQILENALYRIVQEALTNACKHSMSQEVKVTMTQDGQNVRLEVRDWGIGFDPESVEKGHFGLEGIRQRVRLLGGRLTIESTLGSGTLLQVVVPIVERQDDG